MIQETQNTYSSNGNLIITGEYFVLTGAKALAVPLKYNQQMKALCFANSKNVIQWEANELGKPWFKADFNSEDLNILSSNNTELALGLQKILKAILKIKPLLFSKDTLYQFSCDIQFSTSWGWGSSSTLITNMANWAGIDPFELNKQVSSGSGYDIAASNSTTPIVYQINGNGYKITPVAFDPRFKKNIYFIYLGRKQNTSASIEKNIKSVRSEKMVPVITWLTEKIANEDNMNEFIRYIVEHEIIISKTLKTLRIKEENFNDFDGEIKSLGAWGGDFAMVVSSLPEIHIKSYFKSKGLETFFRFDEIIKN
jgi:mevalonate kinase